MRRKALILAVLTTLLWSGSYILNKLAFAGGVGPLTLSGLRYLLASLFLLCIGKGKRQKEVIPLKPGMILLLGFLGYAIAQGLQYVGQSYLTPTQSSLFLSVGNTACVMLVDLVWLRENQTRSDLVKLLVLLAGITLYYYPFHAGKFSAAGLTFIALSSVGYALNMTINRRLLTTGQANVQALVMQPMFAGAVMMLTAGFILEGLPVITLNLLLILLYLSVFSGALGFTLWTKSQQVLSAFESSSINNLMLIEIALLDLFVFHRSFSVIQILAIFIVFLSIMSIQYKKKQHGK